MSIRTKKDKETEGELKSEIKALMDVNEELRQRNSELSNSIDYLLKEKIAKLEARIRDLNWKLKQAKAPAMRRYVVVNSKTNGLPISNNAPVSELDNWPRIIHLAWAIVESNGRVVKRENHIIYPEGFKISKDYEQRYGISTKLAKDEGDDLVAVLDSFVGDTQKSDYIVGHNVDFHKKVIAAELLRANQKDVISNSPSICTMFQGYQCAEFKFCKWPSLIELYQRLFGHQFKETGSLNKEMLMVVECLIEMLKKGIIEHD